MAANGNRNAEMGRYKSALHMHALKATPQRLAIHGAMLDLGHASADMVSQWLERDGGLKISVASVYNTLIQLASVGIYKRRLSANNKMYFDVNTGKHLHLYDIKNHCYKDIVDNELMEMIRHRLSGRRFRGYKIEDVDVQIICRPTRKLPGGKLPEKNA